MSAPNIPSQDNSSHEASPERLGVILAALAALGFSFKAIFVKLAYGVPQAVPVDAVTLLSLRMAFSLPVFAIVAWRAAGSAPALTRRDWLALAGLGMVGYYGASIFDFVGLQYISAGLERLILFTYPTLTVLIAVLFLGKQLTRREVSALVLSYIGIGFAFVHDLEFSGDSGNVVVGAAFIFASSVTYAVYLTGSGAMIRRIGSARFTAWALLISTLATQTHFSIAQPYSALIQPLPVYAYSAAMAVFSTILPVFMLSAAIRRIGSPKTALIGTLGPVLTIFFSWWLLGEPISMAQIVGTVLVVTGVLLVSRR